MKKLFTLLVCVFSISAVFAQYGREGYDRPYAGTVAIGSDHDNYRDFDRRDDHFRRDVIDRINWKYDARIAEVQRNPYMRYFEKERTIRSLEIQRREEISMAYRRVRGDRW